MSSTSDRPTPDRRGLPPLDASFRLAATAILLAWLAFAAAYLRHWSAWPIGLVASAVAVRSFQQGRALARLRHAELTRAIDAATARNRELDLLRGLASTLLSLRSSKELFDEVARVAKDLIRADGGAVLLRAPEGDFLRVVAGEGLMEAAAGRLLPIAGSFAGAALTAGGPLRTDHLRQDPRNHPVAGVDANLDASAVVPLRSRRDIIGVIAVYRRVGGGGFSDLDVSLLEALAEQVEVGLDRAAMLEDAKRNHAALEEANRELVRATEMKSQFLANMSHELRTPLNAIIGFSELLGTDSRLDETQRDYLESIARNGRHLLGMITSVLDAAKLEAGRMVLHAERVDVKALVESAIDDTASLRLAKDQRCRASFTEGPLLAMADAGKIRQVLLNLLSNATKFTATGGSITVSVATTTAPLPDESGRLAMRPGIWIAIADTGVGIASEDLPRLFQPFSQLEGPRRAEPGTGLGLALCKQLVELHGGTIGVESTPGRGSTFWFVLPG